MLDVRSSSTNHPLWEVILAEEKALMVALTDETGAETDVADPKRVEGNHFDIIACGQKRLGCITCK